MFAKLKQQMSEFLREMEEHDELIDSLSKLLQSDTERLIDIEYVRLEDHAFANGVTNVRESDYAHIRERIDVGGQNNTFGRYTPETLSLLHDTFSPDPDGFNQLVREIGPYSHRDQAFIHERIAFPVEIGLTITRKSIREIYRDCRTALGVDDMSDLPPEKHAGVVAIIKAALVTATVESRHHVSNDEYKMPVMTTAFASLVMAFPDRTDDIITYMDEHGLEAVEVDAGHLHDVLNAPAHSLRNGIL